MLTGQDATDNMLPQLKMPVLIVWGDVDRITPLSQGETMHRLVPQSELDGHSRLRPSGSRPVRRPDWPQDGGVCEAVETIDIPPLGKS